MKKLVALLAVAAIACGLAQTTFADTSSVVSEFVAKAKSASDSELGSIAAQLAGKIDKLGPLLQSNPSFKTKLDSTLKSLTGGMDSDALGSAFDLAKSAKLTPEQTGLVKEVGNLTSAYVVQKNFASLEGAKGDVSALVSSLREGKLTSAVVPLKNISGNAHLTDGQKQLISKVADKYAPGWKKAGDALKKIPGFGN